MVDKYRVQHHIADAVGTYNEPYTGDSLTIKHIGEIVETKEEQSNLGIFNRRPAVRVSTRRGDLTFPLDVLEGPLAAWEIELLTDDTVYEESADSVASWDDDYDPWEDSAYDEYDDSPPEEHDGSQDSPEFKEGDKVLFNEAELREADRIDTEDQGMRGFARGILARGMGGPATVTNPHYALAGEVAPIELKLVDGTQAWAEPEWLRHEDDLVGPVAGEATAVMDGIVRLPEGMKPAPRDGGYVVIDGEIAGTYDKPVEKSGPSYTFSILPDPVNAEAPSLIDLDGALDLSGFTTSMEFSIVDPEPEAVDHPAHYGGEDDPFEVIKVIEAWGLGYNLGNVLKYVRRAGKKNPKTVVQDLHKAAWHINREADNLEANNV